MSRQIKKGLLHLLPMLVLALALGISPNSEAKSASEDADDESERGIVLRKDRECTDCHDESSEYPILAIGKTKHGTTADSRTPDSCKSCHGESNDHLDGR